jgi:hypothetical protein
MCNCGITIGMETYRSNGCFFSYHFALEGLLEEDKRISVVTLDLIK